MARACIIAAVSHERGEPVGLPIPVILLPRDLLSVGRDLDAEHMAQPVVPPVCFLACVPDGYSQKVRRQRNQLRGVDGQRAAGQSRNLIGADEGLLRPCLEQRLQSGGVEIEQSRQHLRLHRVQIVAGRHPRGEQGAQTAPLLVGDERFDTEDALEFQRTDHLPVRGRGQVAPLVVERLGAVQREAVVEVDVVRYPGDRGDDRRPREADSFEGCGEQRRARPVDGHETAFVLDGEAHAVGGGVGRTREQEFAIAFDVEECALGESAGEALLFFKDQGAVVRAVGGEQVEEGVLEAASGQFALEGLLGEGGALDFGGRHGIDVGREDDQRGEHPQGGHEDEAGLRAPGRHAARPAATGSAGARQATSSSTKTGS